MNNKFQEQLDTRTLYCLLAYYRNTNSGLKDLLKKKGLDDSQIVEGKPNVIYGSLSL